MAGVSAFVLAGGKSSRMGADKAFVELGGRRLLDRALELAGAVASDVRIVGSAEKFTRFGRVVEDEFPDCGPLGGIQAALRASQTELNLVLAVDLPFVEVGFLKYLLSEAGATKGVVTVPRAGGGWQPLCAVYRREFAAVAETALRQSKNKIDPLFGLVEVRAVDEEELKKCGFSADMFRNLNTPEELGEANRA
jgi:molybdopterin-guanine dinucleotide biosynthesis protein A